MKLSTSEERDDHAVQEHKYPLHHRYKHKTKNNKKCKQKQSTNSMDCGDAMGMRGGKLPSHVSFGRGSSRGFKKSGRVRNVFKSQSEQNYVMDTTVDIQDIKMEDLVESLP